MQVIFEMGVDTKVTKDSIVKFENSTCLATKNGTHFVITSKYNECNTQIGETSDDIVFSNRVIVDPNTGSTVQRLKDTEHVYPVACLLRKENVVVSGQYNYTGIIIIIIIIIESPPHLTRFFVIL